MGWAQQKSRSELLQRNEQVKAVSSVARTAGFALVASGAGQWFLEGLDGNVMLWLLVGSGTIWAGVTVLVLLEVEV